MKRVLLDTMVWVKLKKDEEFLKELINIYRDNDIEIVFSHGNFLDLVRRREQDKLSMIISMFSDHYLGPFSVETEGGFVSSKDPLVLALIDEDWYRHCKVGTAGYNKATTLKMMFKEGYFDAEPAYSVLNEYIETLRNVEDIEIDGEMTLPEDETEQLAAKKLGIFSEYAEPQEDGMQRLNEADIPINKFVFGMSLIYLSETYHEPEVGDYRDAVIWSQAILSGCDILWTEVQWTYEHPIIDQIQERLDRKDLKVVHDLQGFKKQLNN